MFLAAQWTTTEICSLVTLEIAPQGSLKFQCRLRVKEKMRTCPFGCGAKGDYDYANRGQIRPQVAGHKSVRGRACASVCTRGHDGRIPYMPARHDYPNYPRRVSH